MGTRNLTMVISNGETKIAQYGQWDGYPDGQGATALEFLHKVNLDQFKERLSSLRWLNDQDIEKINNDDNWKINHPYLSRDRGADILNIVMGLPYNGGKNTFNGEIVGLQDESSFAGDSLSNEWTYVIDLDKKTFEVYRGYNKTPLAEGERFFNLKNEYKASSSSYYAVRHLKTYSLESLPSEEDFINDFTEKE